MKVLDQDQSGTLDPLEFKAVTRRLDMAKVDLDRDGQINIEELRGILLGTTPLKENYRGWGRYARPDEGDDPAPDAGSGSPRSKKGH